MTIIIYFSWGRGDAYEIEQSELERQNKDRLSYQETGKLIGGASKARVTVVKNPSPTLLLKFDEVAAIG